VLYIERFVNGSCQFGRVIAYTLFGFMIILHYFSSAEYVIIKSMFPTTNFKLPKSFKVPLASRLDRQFNLLSETVMMYSAAPGFII